MNGIRILLAMVSFGLLAAAAQQEPPKALYVVTYVDVYPNFAADAAKALQQFATDSRKDAGAVRFEILRDVARANHFSILEVWQTQRAFDSHSTIEHTRLFREKIQPMLGSPFDQRLYNLVQ